MPCILLVLIYNKECIMQVETDLTVREMKSVLDMMDKKKGKTERDILLYGKLITLKNNIKDISHEEEVEPIAESVF